jgi:hypothetical protein
MQKQNRPSCTSQMGITLGLTGQEARNKRNQWGGECNKDSQSLEQYFWAVAGSNHQQADGGSQ